MSAELRELIQQTINHVEEYFRAEGNYWRYMRGYPAKIRQQIDPAIVGSKMESEEDKCLREAERCRMAEVFKEHEEARTWEMDAMEGLVGSASKGLVGSARKGLVGSARKGLVGSARKLAAELERLGEDTSGLDRIIAWAEHGIGGRENALRLWATVKGDLKRLAGRLAKTTASKAGASQKRPGSANSRMLETIQGNQESVYWSVRQWSAHLKCSISTIHNTPTWKSLHVTHGMAEVNRQIETSKGRRVLKKKARPDED
jgi:hypothetical protein